MNNDTTRIALSEAYRRAMDMIESGSKRIDIDAWRGQTKFSLTVYKVGEVIRADAKEIK